MFIWKVPPRVSLLLIWKVLLPAHRSLVTWESPTENPTDVGFVTVPHMQRPMQRPTPPLVPSLEVIKYTYSRTKALSTFRKTLCVARHHPRVF
jgi:hypothetical protein